MVQHFFSKNAPHFQKLFYLCPNLTSAKYTTLNFRSQKGRLIKLVVLL